MIAVEQLTIRQGNFALHDVSFRVERGEYAFLMGKTGCGKTTLLEVIAGLRRPAAGRIQLAGRDVTRMPPGAREVGYVPQDLALFQTMTVRDHLAFAMLIRKLPADRIAARVAELAEWLGITHLLERRPPGLSGGEAQRVALGRALSLQSRILLLDEPLSSLDEDTHDEIVTLLERLRQRGDVTVLHVTHNRREADRLSDLVLTLKDGRLREERGGRTAAASVCRGA